MKKVLWLVSVYLITAVLVLSSCTQNAAEAPAKTGTETITNASAASPAEPNILVPTVPPVTLISIKVEPAYPSKLSPGLKQQFKATGTYSDGTIKDISSQVTWKSSDETIAVITASGEAYGVTRVTLPPATLPSDKPVAPSPGGPPPGGARSPPPGSPPPGGAKPTPPGARSSIPLISLTADVMVTATLSGITSAPVTLTVIKAPLRDLPPLDAFMKGVNFDDPMPLRELTALPPERGLYASPGAEESLINLAATGTGWIALAFSVTQETITSTEITRHPIATASEPALRRMIDLAHSLGMRVALNPLVQLSRDPTRGHIQIGTAFTTEEQWQAWFASYRQIIVQYAELAQDAGTDMFFIGNELHGTVRREADWRRIAQEVRQVYKGPIIYEATTNVHPLVSEESEDLQIKWWDAVDYIGVLGYFPLTESNNPTVEDLKSVWVKGGYLSRLEALSRKFQRPIIISEIGYQSADGTNTYPANFPRLAQAPVDQQEQADCYQAALEVLWEKPWLRGIFWFQWFVNPNEPGLIGNKDKNESPQGKLAEEVLKKFYQSK